MNSMLRSIELPSLSFAVSITIIAAGIVVHASSVSAAAPEATMVEKFRTPKVVCYETRDGSGKPRRYEKEEVKDVRIVDEDDRGFYLLGSPVGGKDCWVRAGQVTTDLGKATKLPACPPLSIADGRAPGVRNVGEGCR